MKTGSFEIAICEFLRAVVSNVRDQICRTHHHRPNHAVEELLRGNPIDLVVAFARILQFTANNLHRTNHKNEIEYFVEFVFPFYNNTNET